MCKEVTGCLVKQSDTIERIDFDMRQFLLFLVFFLGLFWVVDVVAFDGVNSAGTWKEATHLGKTLSRPVLDQARRYLF